MGELTSPLYPGPVDRWDLGNTACVRFYGAANLLSLTEAQVLGGAGAIAVKNEALGEWEVLQYQNATLVGTNSYNLTKLLRGQLGTEGAMRDPAPTGTRVVALDAATLTPLDMGLDRRGLVQTLRYGPSPYPVSDPRYRGASLVAASVGLRSVLGGADRRAPGVAGGRRRLHLDSAHALRRRQLEPRQCAAERGK